MHALLSHEQARIECPAERPNRCFGRHPFWPRLNGKELFTVVVIENSIQVPFFYDSL